MKSFTLTICFLFACLSFSQEEEKDKNTFDTIDTILLNGKDYSVGINHDEASFKLKISNLDSSKTSLSIPKSVSKETLYTVVINLTKALDSDLDIDKVSKNDTEKNHLLGLKKRVDDYYEKQLRKDLTEAQNVLRDIDNEKDQYSAKMVLHKTIPYKTSEEPPSAKSDSIKILLAELNKINALDGYQKVMKEALLSQIQDQESDKAQKSKTSKKKDAKYKGQGTLEIIDAKLTFFNNKASSVYIKATLTENDSTETLIFLNNDFSVPLRYFNNYGSTVSIQSKNRASIRIDYNDVFDYESDQNFNYSIANSQISLSNANRPKKTHESKIIQRRFFDFFTAVVYSDVMGFNSENANAILNAQAKLLIPLNLRNKNKWSITRQFTTTANIALDNSFQNDTRFISVVDNGMFSNFDLLRKNNLYGKLELDLLSYESKGWFLTTSLGYSAGFYRTGLRYTDTQTAATDNVIEKQLFSVGHGPYLNFEIRPQNNFGADVKVSLEDLNFSDENSIGNRSFDNIINETGKDHFIMPYNMINLEANFYWLTSPNKSTGGIYAKVGSYFHTESNRIFPQVQVGYATNLTSFVNKFNAKKTPEIKSED